MSTAITDYASLQESISDAQAALQAQDTIVNLAKPTIDRLQRTLEQAEA